MPSSSTHATQELNAPVHRRHSVCHPAKEETPTTGNLTSIMTSLANYAFFETRLFSEQVSSTVYCINKPRCLQIQQKTCTCKGEFGKRLFMLLFPTFLFTKAPPLRLRLLLLPASPIRRRILRFRSRPSGRYWTPRTPRLPILGRVSSQCHDL